MKKLLAPLIILVVVLVAVLSVVLSYRGLMSAPEDSPQGEYKFVVQEGDVLLGIADTLAEDNVIESPLALRIASYSAAVEPLQTGEYLLILPASPAGLIEQINEQSIEKREFNRNSANALSKRVIIREGLSLDEVADLLEQEQVINKSEFLELANSPEVFRQAYEFLPEPLNCQYGILENCAKYYLEGYIYPDTYTFAVNGSTQGVIDQMLKNFEAKVYDRLETDLDSDELYRTLIVASLIEKETGRTRGVTEGTASELQQERKIMAAVFSNRISLGIKLQSDPTVTYGLGELKVCQQTFDLEGCVFLDDPRVLTQYNTYYIDGLPIGPTTSPQWAVVEAVLNPVENDNLYFVSDVTGKKYFAETDAQHLENIEFVTELNETIQ